jgi:hypothetical protein
MRRLKHRVARVQGSHKRAMNSYTPVSTGAQVTGGNASPTSADVMPLAQVSVYPAPGGYATIAYRGLAPIFTADGAAVPATAPGRWAQLFAAGRP